MDRQIVMITHDDEIAQVADRILLVIEDGQVRWILIEGRISKIAFSNDEKKSDKKYPHYDGDLPDYHAFWSLSVQLKWTDPLTQKDQGCKLIRKQLRPVYRRRWYAIKRSGTQS